MISNNLLRNIELKNIQEPPPNPSDIEILHRRAIESASEYRKNETQLLEIICSIEEKKVFLSFGYTSLFAYCVGALKLAEGTNYNLISVARKSKVVPQLKTAITTGAISISKATKIASVITPKNQSEWIAKAADLSRQELEKHVAAVNPKVATTERISYVTDKRMALKLGLSEELYKNLKRVQDLESKRQRKSVSIEEVLEVLVPLYLDKKDPVIRAEKRQGETTNREPMKNTRKGIDKLNTNSSTGRVQSHGSLQTSFIPFARKPLSSDQKSAVTLRDKGKCLRCENSRFIEIHHIIPLSHGGTNDINNLQTLCSAHHKMQHMEMKSWL